MEQEKRRTAAKEHDDGEKLMIKPRWSWFRLTGRVELNNEDQSIQWNKNLWNYNTLHYNAILKVLGNSAILGHLFEGSHCIGVKRRHQLTHIKAVNMSHDVSSVSGSTVDRTSLVQPSAYHSRELGFPHCNTVHLCSPKGVKESQPNNTPNLDCKGFFFMLNKLG